MRIAIIESETHTHLLFLWEELLKGIKNIEYKFYVTLSIANDIQEIPQAKKVIIKVEDIDKNIQEFKSYDIIIFNTLHRNFNKFASIFTTCNVLLLVHNANFYFHSVSPNWGYLKKVKDKTLIYYYLKLIFKEKIYRTKNIINKAKGYGFLNLRIARDNQVPGKPNFVIPLQYNYFFSSLETSDELRVVIPGNVSQNRRDYEFIFEILKTIKPKEKLRFIFLGKPESLKMIKNLETVKKSVNSNIQIEYYTERIPQNHFTEQMNQAHFVLCPILKETQFYLQKEIYGKSKASGNESDCIHYGKIGIFPDYYTIQDWTCIYYKDKKTLSAILEELTFKTYKYYHQELSTKIDFFSKKNSQEQLLTIFKAIQNR